MFWKVFNRFSKDHKKEDDVEVPLLLNNHDNFNEHKLQLLNRYKQSSSFSTLQEGGGGASGGISQKSAIINEGSFHSTINQSSNKLQVGDFVRF